MKRIATPPRGRAKIWGVLAMIGLTVRRRGAGAADATFDAAAPAPSQFTPEQRAEIVNILRTALKSDPSILRDAVVALQADEAQRQDASSRAAHCRRSECVVGVAR